MAKKIKCPFCEFEFRVDVEAIYEQGQVNVVRGAKRQGPTANQGERYVDLKCPKCAREFEQEV